MKEMLRIMGTVAILITLTLFMGVGQVVAAEEVFEFKISVDTAPSAHRNQALVIFIEELQKRSHGKLVPKYFHSGQLYKDAHIPKAFRAGNVDMAVPGNWLLEGVDTSANIIVLPMFFGQPIKISDNLVDGDFGKAVNERLQKKLNAIIPGRWFWQAEISTFFKDKKVTKPEDFKGLKIRNAGGAVAAAMYEAFGATAVFIAWPDVPMALMQGTVDGLVSACKSVESAKLHEAGLKYGLLWRSSSSYYIPLVSLKFWNRLTPDLQKTFREVWEEVVPRQREIAHNEQREAQKFLESKGMEFYQPSDQVLAKWREEIVMPHQDKLIKELKMDPDLIQMAKKPLGM